MYKQFKTTLGEIANSVIRTTDSAVIPFDPANTDYQKFKSDVLAGAELQDADGNVMDSEQVMEFLKNLP